MTPCEVTVHVTMGYTEVVCFSYQREAWLQDQSEEEGGQIVYFKDLTFSSLFAKKNVHKFTYQLKIKGKYTCTLIS